MRALAWSAMFLLACSSETPPSAVDAALDTVEESDGAEDTFEPPFDGGPLPPPLASDLWGPGALALGDTELFVSLEKANTVIAVPIAGGATRKVADTPALCPHLSLDASRVFAVCAGRLVRMPRAGGAVTTMAAHFTLTGAVAVRSGRVYFALRTAVLSVPVDFEMPTSSGDAGADAADDATDASDPTWPAYAKVEATGFKTANSVYANAGQLYVYSYPEGPGSDGAIDRLDPTTGTLKSIATALVSPPLGFSISAGKLYFSLPTGIWVVPIGGGSLTRALAITGLFGRVPFAVDASGIYALVGDPDGRAHLQRTVGDTTDILAVGQLRPGEIVLDSTSIYWTTIGGGYQHNGTVVRLAK